MTPSSLRPFLLSSLKRRQSVEINGIALNMKLSMILWYNQSSLELERAVLEPRGALIVRSVAQHFFHTNLAGRVRNRDRGRLIVQTYCSLFKFDRPPLLHQDHVLAVQTSSVDGITCPWGGIANGPQIYGNEGKNLIRRNNCQWNSVE